MGESDTDQATKLAAPCSTDEDESSSPKGEDIPAIAAVTAAPMDAQHVAESLQAERDLVHGGG